MSDDKKGIGPGAGTDEPPAPPDFTSEDVYAQFRASLPEDIREAPLFADTKTLHSLAEQSLHAQRSLGKKRLEAPAEDWTDEQWGEFFKNVAPEDPKAYEFPEKMELRLTEDGDLQNYEMKEETAERLRGVAAELQLSPAQAKKLATIWGKQELSGGAELDQQIQGAVEEGINKVREEWGAEFELNHRSANEAYDALVNEVPELKELMEWSPIVANHPAVLKLFHRLAPLVKDMGTADGAGRVGSGFQQETVEGIKSEIAELEEANNFLLFGNHDEQPLSIADQAKREKILARRAELFKKLHAE